MKRIAISFGDPAKVGPYENALREAGLEPIRNPDSMEGLDGLLLTGGTDVNPELYGEEPHPETQSPDTPRDEREAWLLHDALNQDKPVLAICRGLQFFNVFHGGTLIQHVEGHDLRTPEDPSRDAHKVTAAPGTKLAGIVGEGDHPVNSRHHQIVGKIGAGLTVSAKAGKIIEGLERPDKRFAVAVQWHPEDRMNCASDRGLFEEFAKAVNGE